MNIEYADATSTAGVRWDRCHPSVIASVNRRRAEMGLSLITSRGNTSAQPIQRRGGAAVSPRLSSALTQGKAAAAIVALKRARARAGR